MISAALLIAASLTSPVAAQNDAIAACLVNLSNAPEFADKGNEELSGDDDFLSVAIDSWCSDEVSKYWSEAHIQARRQLGAPDEGYHVEGQQQLAEQNMKKIVAESWRKASETRSAPPPLSKEKLDELGLDWLLTKAEQDKVLDEAFEGPVVCVANKLAKNGFHTSEATIEEAEIKLPAIGNYASQCKYDAAIASISRMVSERFPSSDKEFAERTANAFMGKMLFWATLAAAKEN